MRQPEQVYSRIDLALERLAECKSFDFGPLTLHVSKDDNKLVANVSSSWILENVTTERALADLEEAKQFVESLGSENAEFAGLLETHPLQFVLVDDYGTGKVEIGRLVEGELVWAKGFKLY
jgi:hypothetical protein